jgi:type VI secretion system protein VasG
VILTSNVGTDAITTLCKDPDLIPDQDAIATALREPLLKVFPAALLGRVVTVPYYPLSDAMLSNIVTLQLSRVQTRIAQNHNAAFTYDDAAIKLIISRCTEVESGGRMIDAVLTNTVLPKISAEYLQRVVDGRALASISLSAENNQFQFKFG